MNDLPFYRIILLKKLEKMQIFSGKLVVMMLATIFNRCHGHYLVFTESSREFVKRFTLFQISLKV